jgi:hypothetical protein
VRWLQDVRRFKPSTVSRRLSVVAGFYRTCVIDGALEHSPADYVRRPTVPPESPTLGVTHLQFEAMLTAARESSNPFDFARVCLLGVLGPVSRAVGRAAGDRLNGPNFRGSHAPTLSIVGAALSHRSTRNRTIPRACATLLMPL